MFLNNSSVASVAVAVAWLRLFPAVFRRILIVPIAISGFPVGFMRCDCAAKNVGIFLQKRAVLKLAGRYRNDTPFTWPFHYKGKTYADPELQIKALLIIITPVIF